MHSSNTAHLISPGRKEVWQNIRPIFVLSAPRAGSTLLFELLTQHLPCLSIGNESHSIYRRFPELHKENANYDSGSLSRHHATAEISQHLRQAFASQLSYQDGSPPDWEAVCSGKQQPVFIEKTPRNALNIPFLREVFPHARFIYLYRNGQQNIASLIEGWQFGQRTGHFVTFPDLPGFVQRNWCFLLPPGWRTVKDASIADIATFQWLQTNQTIRTRLSELPQHHWCAIAYEQLIDEPVSQLQRLASFCGLRLRPSARRLRAHALPLSATTLSQPDSHKWQRFSAELAKHENAIKHTMLATQRFADTSTLKDSP
ncbi:sulfotransferase family protein [Alteromonas gilva]|uniref:Sulfotransferase n=1 Tax=Alteromonas gilva TaxID=2987522 RepID=A0ABT5L8Y1_9ALTE|nr:sulfotransferase [Alteromonas gilva]MDC8832462.1 sulfotransferase [Alteromonas gilva]